MIRLAVLALIGAVSAVGAAQAVVSFDRKHSVPELRAALAIAPTTTSEGGAASIAKGADGHYWAEADVNGSHVRFLVDTGASAVALTTQDAKRLGFDPSKLNYAYKVITASGETRAAAVKLGRISIAGAEVADVDALVIEEGLETSLLGMSYLGRLSRFEATKTALILRP
ncbi:TIGR02281 family clan AA aspartic protease [Phenylobacterium sp.]|uniref:TIGR02281 family clan AA aspartic protease n=1 Tax=Phenylobacterium sp. TaxID=1871053 RepID=UPI002869F2FD|nr:TIGR02281 family clan AA aspartic protease [Phenylobacterium sp.]